MSTPPYATTAAAYIAATLAASLTSTSTKVARLHSAAVWAPAERPVSATTTEAPSSEKSTDASRPIPPAAPVITATFPSRRPISVSALRCHEHVLDLGVTVEGVHPQLASEPGLLEAPEGCRHPHRGIAVDRKHAGLERSRDAQRTSTVGRPDRSGQSIRCVVGDPYRIGLVAERNDGRDRPEDLVACDAVAVGCLDQRAWIP